MYEWKSSIAGSERLPIHMDWKPIFETRVSDSRHFTAADKLAVISSPLGQLQLQTVVHRLKQSMIKC